jgi:NAD(P)-dependent dehydrogenase (short-subunit alcohol dehydrogenase family)
MREQIMSNRHGNGEWSVDRISDQKGRRVIITGSSSGIGKECANALAKKNASIVVAARSAKKGEATVEEIRKEYPAADVELIDLDLSNLQSVASFCAAYSAKYDRLDLLINNAGIMFCPYSTTANGFEIQMGTNHLGHFALVGHLMPLLQKTPDSRLVVLSSSAEAMGNLDFDDLNWRKRKYSPQRAYGDSKLATLYFAYELARRLEGQLSNPRVTAAHPGWTATDLQRHSLLMKILNPIVGQRVDMGALPILRAAFDAEAKAGDYFGPSKFFHLHGYPVNQKSSKRSYDFEASKKLWAYSQEMTGMRY